jgi:hypothetical protein
MLDERSQEVPVFSAIRPSKRPTSLVTRVTAGLPDMPHYRKRQSRPGAAVIATAVAGLVAVLMGVAAVIFRDKLASIVSRGDGGEEQAPVAAQAHADGSEAEAPVAAQD